MKGMDDVCVCVRQEGDSSTCRWAILLVSRWVYLHFSQKGSYFVSVCVLCMSVSTVHTLTPYQKHAHVCYYIFNIYFYFGKMALLLQYGAILFELFFCLS